MINTSPANTSTLMNRQQVKHHGTVILGENKCVTPPISPITQCPDSLPWKGAPKMWVLLPEIRRSRLQSRSHVRSRHSVPSPLPLENHCRRRGSPLCSRCCSLVSKRHLSIVSWSAFYLPMSHSRHFLLPGQHNHLRYKPEVISPQDQRIDSRSSIMHSNFLLLR